MLQSLSSAAVVIGALRVKTTDQMLIFFLLILLLSQQQALIILLSQCADFIFVYFSNLNHIMALILYIIGLRQITIQELYFEQMLYYNVYHTVKLDTRRLY